VKRYALFASLFAALSTGAAICQSNATEAVTSRPPDPAAFVYVSSTPGTGANVVNAYTAAANGKLTRVSGSPFNANVGSMAVNGKYLFGANQAGVYVAAFLMESNGALRWTTSSDVAQHNPSGCKFPGALVLDHTGADLYYAGTAGGECDSTLYQSFKIQSSNGLLSFLGNTPVSDFFNSPLSFSGNNVYAYGTACIDFQGGYLDTFATYKRESNGLMVATPINAAPPTPKNSGDFYCRALAAADPTNHLALALQAIDNSTSMPDGLPQLATYTAASNGNLSTTSTFANMPTTTVGYLTAMSMSPSGKLLALGGQSGLQIFHYNGASPITHYTGLLTGDDIEQIFWDNQNHLYAISWNAQKLFVFTITSTSATQAPGSPYTIAHPKNIIVQPK
jgi:hypothetical protein